jgi:acyl-CoA hydrolase
MCDVRCSKARSRHFDRTLVCDDAQLLFLLSPQHGQVHTRLRGSGMTIAQIVQIGAIAAAKRAPKEAYTITTHVHLGPRGLFGQLCPFSDD